MNLHEDTALLMARERMEDAMRFAEQRRLLRHARGPRQPARVRLGLAIVRLGRWLMGSSPEAPRAHVGLEQTQP